MDKQFKIKAVVSAILFAGLASTASAVTFTVGGATLPQPLYEAEYLDPVNSTHTWHYGGVGSGGGRTGFLTNNAVSVQGTAGQTVQFGASDAAMTSTEYNNYISSAGLGNLGSSAGNGRMIQIPMVATPVLVYAKSASVTSTNLATLAKSQLCGVMSGRLTQWNQISSTLPSTPITVIVRQESSGTTTLLTQHLAAVCTAAETTRADNTVVTFSGNGTFRNNFPGNTLPANFVQVEGSGGVQSALNSTPEAIAYLSPDPDYTPGAGTYALRLRNANDGVSYAPAEANINTALAASLIPPTGTLVTDPAAAGYSATDNPGNPLNWVKLVSNPSAGYPIVGTTNLLLSQCYSDARTPGQPTATESALRAYLDNHFANATRIRDHAFVPLPSTLVSAIRGAFTVGNTNGGQLLIGAATAYCSSVAGR